MKLKLIDLIKIGINGFDMSDKTFDYLNYFEFDKDSMESIDLVMEWIAKNLDVVKIIGNDCIICDIVKFLNENKKMIIDFTKKFWRDEYQLNNENWDIEVALDSWFSDILNGNLNDEMYKWIITYYK